MTHIRASVDHPLSAVLLVFENVARATSFPAVATAYKKANDNRTTD